MRTKRYDSTARALFHPEFGPPVDLPATPPAELLCAELSRLVYKKFEKSNDAKSELETAIAALGLDDLKCFHSHGTQALGVRSPALSAMIIAFRGTDGDPTDLITDVEGVLAAWAPGGHVHRGFSDAFARIWSNVNAWLDSQGGPVIFTGHSLGAALATLAATKRAAERLIIFGSPRVGDADFAGLFRGQTNVERFVNCCDVVCNIPPEWLGFEHVSKEIYIDRDGALHTNLAQKKIEEDQTQARVQYFADFSFRFGSVPVRDLADHAPINYVYGLTPEVQPA